MSDTKLYLYPIWLRIWHGINAICIILLGITGISMQYTSIESPLIKFKTAVSIHNTVGAIIVIGYLFYFIANFITENNKHYQIKFRGLFSRLSKQGQYYLFGYLKGDPKPFHISEKEKFNPLQKVSYNVAMYTLVPIAIITGVALFFPEMIIEKIYAFSGIQLTTFFHSLAGFFILVFLIIHLYVITIGKHPLRNFKSIINGYHDVD